jgi:hypothetical protein
VKKSFLIVSVALSLGVVGCGGGSSSSGGSSEPSNSFGLNGTWGGIAEDVDLDMATISATIEDRSISRFEIDGVVTGETAVITQLEPDVFDYLSNFGVIGGFLTDPGKSYAVVVNEDWDFAVVQKGASAPYGTATIVDLGGSWVGSVSGFFDNTYYRYPATGECGSGFCIFTATGPVVDENGTILADLTGTQATWEVSHRASLAFDATISNSLGGGGSGAGFLSKDKRFFGAYGCPPSMVLEECEIAAMVKR